MFISAKLFDFLTGVKHPKFSRNPPKFEWELEIEDGRAIPIDDEDLARVLTKEFYFARQENFDKKNNIHTQRGTKTGQEDLAALQLT
ncbi:hypothetical protein B484DRAFT_396371 [Ochromonadaceae sp. CCMP2298]|nr:hypothetical protein B484DRAFT_396371 [Ochromonadaceae sp. CCMP2298]